MMFIGFLYFAQRIDWPYSLQLGSSVPAVLKAIFLKMSLRFVGHGYRSYM